MPLNWLILWRSYGQYVATESYSSAEDLCTAAFSKVFDAVGSYCSYCGRDSTAPLLGKSWLDTRHSALHPPYGIPEVIGVNTPMWYVGGPGSVTALHVVKNGDLASLNLLLAGEDKLWGLFAPPDCGKLETKLAEYLVVDKPCLLYHKPGLLIDPRLMKDWGIGVHFVVQKVGDLLYVDEEVPHFVVNNGLNIAEAINFEIRSVGGIPARTMCECADVGRMRRENFDLQLSVIMLPSVKRTHVCGVNSCVQQFFYKLNLVAHRRQEHPQYTVPCRRDDCSSVFTSEKSEVQHQREFHGSSKIRCTHEGCEKEIIARNFKNHVEEQLGTPDFSICCLCQLQMLTRNLKPHLRCCTGPLVCKACGRVFKLRRTLAAHSCKASGTRGGTG